MRGHFPGLSIIPGAVLLGWVWAAAHALELPIRPEVRSTKYLQSILPGDRIEFIFSKQGSGVRVQVRKGQDLAAEFRLLYGKNVSKT